MGQKDEKKTEGGKGELGKIGAVHIILNIIFRSFCPLRLPLKYITLFPTSKREGVERKEGKGEI